MPRPTAHKTRDSPTFVSNCDLSRHKPGVGIMAFAQLRIISASMFADVTRPSPLAPG
jgi:hypothetical protein